MQESKRVTVLIETIIILRSVQLSNRHTDTHTHTDPTTITLRRMRAEG